MKLNAVGIICWIMIVLTTVFIVAAGVVSIISPQKDYLILGIAKMTLSLPPVWCRLMITAVSVQAVATTIIIGVDVKEQKHMKRDLVSTTLIGIVCIIFLIVPFISGFRQTVAETAVYSPKYYVFENNGRQIVIEECSGRVSGYLQSFGDVYGYDDGLGIRRWSIKMAANGYYGYRYRIVLCAKNFCIISITRIYTRNNR